MPETITTKSYQIDRPAKQFLPIVLASPHSGDIYPPELKSKTNLQLSQLRRSEDAFVDQIFAPAVKNGLPLIRARVGRAFVDLNREPYELDPSMFRDPLPAYVNTRSPRIAAGLGTIPKLVACGQQIYREPLAFDAAEALLDTYYKPYHQALETLLQETQAQFGIAILIDCHSMPSSATLPAGTKGKAVDFVLGDCHRSSCDPRIMAFFDRQLSHAGYHISRNRPYAGGYVTQHYGRPARGRHALQLEINRALYMDERQFKPLSSMARLSQQLCDIVAMLGESYLPSQAAE